MITTEIINNIRLDKSSIINLLSVENSEYKSIIESFSNKNKKVSETGQEAIIEISNYCEAECNYCELKNDNNKIFRFRLNREEIIAEALKQHKMGKKSILLHSGYDKFYNTDRITYIIYSIKKEADVKITLSFGLRNFNEYREWKIAGADSYLLNFISSNKSHYNETKSWGTLDDRLLHIDELKKLDYSIGSGSIIGLQNQTISDLANDIILCKNLDLNNIDFCYLNYLGNSFNLPINEIIKRVAEITELAIPNNKVRIRSLIN